MSNDFITPAHYTEIERKRMQGPQGWLLFAACTSGLAFARQVKHAYDAQLEQLGETRKVILLNDYRKDGIITKVCPDEETIPNLPYSVGGSHTYVFQNVHNSTSSSTVNENLMELCQLVRTLKENGAQSVTAVIPYHPYARQDKPTIFEREAVLAKLVADLLVEAGVAKIITYHPHSDAVRAWYEPRAQATVIAGFDFHTSLARRIMAEKKLDKSKIVCCSTDAGGGKYVLKLAAELGVDHAIGTKLRSGTDKSSMLGIIGTIENKEAAFIVDDETVTFGSLYDVAKALYEKNIRQLFILCSHNKLRSSSLVKEAHEKFGVEEVHFTDSVPPIPEISALPFVKIHSLADTFARTINRHHCNMSVSEVFRG